MSAKHTYGNSTNFKVKTEISSDLNKFDLNDRKIKIEYKTITLINRMKKNNNNKQTKNNPKTKTIAR